MPSMTISLPGVIERAAEELEGRKNSRYLSFPLRQLLEHLRELRGEPTEAKLHEFLNLWTDSGAAGKPA